MKTLSRSLAFVALAASAALCGPVQAQYSYSSQPVFNQMERDREIRGIVQDEIRYQRSQYNGGMPSSYSPSRSCTYCGSLIR